MKKHIYVFRDKLKKISCNLIYCNNYKLLKKNKLLNKSIRQKIIFVSYQKSFKTNKNKIKKFCIETGRLRSIVCKSKFNRLNFREMVSKNALPGIFKK